MRGITSGRSLISVGRDPGGSRFTRPLFRFSNTYSNYNRAPCIGLVSRLFNSHRVVTGTANYSSVCSTSVPSAPCAGGTGNRNPTFSGSLFRSFYRFNLNVMVNGGGVGRHVTRLLRRTGTDRGISTRFMTTTSG